MLLISPHYRYQFLTHFKPNFYVVLKGKVTFLCNKNENGADYDNEEVLARAGGGQTPHA